MCFLDFQDSLDKFQEGFKTRTNTENFILLVCSAATSKTQPASITSRPS